MLIKKHKKLILSALLIALLILAISLLPWWLPKDIIRKKLASDFTRQFQRNVEIEHLQLSWSQGITIQNLLIDQSPDFGTGQLLTVRQMNCPFNLRNLIAGKIKSLDIHQADIYIVINNDGRINISELTPVNSDVIIENIALKQAHVHVTYPRRDNSQGTLLFQTEALITQDKKINAAGWYIQCYQNDGTSPVLISRGKTGPLTPEQFAETADLSPRQGTIQIQKLDIAGIPLQLLINKWLKTNYPDNDISDLAGLCDFNGQLNVTEGGIANITGNLQLENLDVTGRNADDPNENKLIHQVNLTCNFTGQYDPALNTTTIKNLDLATSGMKLNLQAGYDPQPGSDKSLTLSVSKGLIEPATLAKHFPILNHYPPLNQIIAGSRGTLTFNAGFDSDNRKQNFHLDIDGNSFGLESQRLNKKIDQPLSLNLRGRFNSDTRSLYIDSFKGQWLCLNAYGTMALPEPSNLFNIKNIEITKIPQLLPQLQLEISVSDLNQLSRNAKLISELTRQLQLQGTANAQLVITPSPQHQDIHLQLALPRETVCTVLDNNKNILLHKEPDRQFTLKFTGRIKTQSQNLQTDQLNITAMYDDAEFKLGPAQIAWLPTDHNLQIEAPWQITDIEKLLSLSPYYQKQLQDSNTIATGNCSGSVELNTQPAKLLQLTGTIDAAATQLQLEPKAGTILRKPTGQPAALNFNIEERFPDKKLSCQITAQLDNFNVKSQDISQSISTDSLLLSGTNITASGAFDLTNAEKPSLIDCGLNIKTQINYDNVTSANSQLLIRLTGNTALDLNLNYQPPLNTFSVNGRCDLTRTALTIPLSDHTLNKPADDTLSIDLALRNQTDSQTIELQKLLIETTGTQLDCAAQLHGININTLTSTENLTDSLSAAVISADLNCAQLEKLTRWWPSADTLNIDGQLNASLNTSLQFKPALRIKLQPLYINGQFHCQPKGIPVSVKMQDLEISSDRWLIPALSINIADNDLTVVADIKEPPLSMDPNSNPQNKSQTNLFIQANNLDLDDLRDNLCTLSPDLDSGGAIPNNPQMQKNILAYLSGCKIDGGAKIERLHYTDPATTAVMNLQQLNGNWQWFENQGSINFNASLGGGTVDAVITCDANQPDCPITYNFSSRDLQADESLGVIVESEFPGLMVSGKISERYELTTTLDCLSDPVCCWTGRGDTLCTDGVLYGPAGPGWILQAFPDLRLVEYPWRKMINRYERLPGGSKKNHMVFKGRAYDIYLDGISSPLRDPNEYEQVMAALDKQCQISWDQTSAIAQGRLKISPQKAALIKRQTQGLAHLWKRKENGEKLPVSVIDYVVGSLIGIHSDDTFDQGAELLRTPFFRSRGYVIGQFMIDMKTTNVPISELGRENPIYRIITQK